ncbi:MAG: DMT family transporter [Clostridiales Family XIII bacterium]|jgi:drug/metabolite transporter (DMT)-like permease|nr:DMT family transporter [Clostridiales Family XIII bacterium]
MKTQETRSTVFLFLTSLIWGFSFVAQVVGAEYVRPFTFNGITFLIGTAVLALVMRVSAAKKDVGAACSRPPSYRKKLLVYGLICGGVLFAASNLQQFGVEITASAGKSGFITGLYIILVPIFGVFMKRRAGLFVWIGAVFAVVGMYFLCVKADEGLGGLTAGDLVLFIGAFFWAAHIIVIDRYGPRVDPLHLALAQYLLNGVLCLVCAAALREPFEPAALAAAALPMLYRGVGSIGIAYTLQILGQRHVAPGKAAVIFSLESVFSALGGALLIHELMTGRSYLGCALIFAGILLVQVPARKPV